MTSNLVVGCAAALTAALLGAGWQIATRHGVTTSFGPLDIALVRYGIPAMVLLPLWRRLGWWPRGIGWRDGVLLMAGGLPFALCVLAGAQLAPVAHMGVFMAGMMPVFTALLALLLHREALTGARLAGLAVILLGVAMLGHRSFEAATGHWRGDLFFLLASLAWSAHTVGFRRCGLRPWQAASLVNGWSVVGVILLLPFTGGLKLLSAPAAELLLQVAWQGVLAGLVGQVVYFVAVARLGSSRAALSGALVPALSALGGAWLLGEALGRAEALAVGAVCIGVLMASGAVRWQGGEAALR